MNISFIEKSVKFHWSLINGWIIAVYIYLWKRNYFCPRHLITLFQGNKIWNEACVLRTIENLVKSEILTQTYLHNSKISVAFLLHFIFFKQPQQRFIEKKGQAIQIPNHHKLYFDKLMKQWPELPCFYNNTSQLRNEQQQQQKGKHEEKSNWCEMILAFFHSVSNLHDALVYLFLFWLVSAFLLCSELPLILKS